ncbi:MULTISPECIES: extracellular solute-binding protein [Ensifer]|uniref:ABC transporter substrate-binding protein n=1 Tax=Ensifer canadensis TaxID=555315 RepID=A0AAW4FFB1_9HYPH|nr:MULTISPECIES: extracellular solute-binding protein [Ensifer]AHK44340.1 putative peptide ABC transporter, substrate-binding protein [Ensifer adhaerens OV14]MDP9634502.1 peptide/nickel transport system substrate-binding protein [Ensifer adhaerens]MBD9490297.1 ABC transporter substrate-binding protein [Ensifer sp. ENS11]MBM3089215.1 ABC transporter substrate-binding protein [Ensifer canadensis]NOV14499.1 ABC transporter substrate-binding protein [Ensifer canadensis]
MRTILSGLAILLAATAFGGAATAAPVHAISMHGEPALPADFKSFPYVNPDVKKGGKISYGVVGTFDSVNPFILKSMRTTARGMWDPEYGNLVYESLMQRSRDEPFTMYGLLAQTVEWDDDRTFIQFNINPDARWADGQPVTADDVIFTFELMRDKGRVPFSNRMAKVAKLEKVGDLSVRFTFTEDADRELPLLLGLSPVLPKHATDVATFDQTTLKAPLGSGPYRVAEVKPGERIVYRRNPDYWAKNLPSKVGFDNYDEISVEYFLQENSLFEAFKKGEIDIYPEGSATKWARGYDFPAVRSGDVVKETFTPKTPSGMLGIVFNTRKPMFDNLKLRQGLALVFDFEWVNKNLFDSAYTRTQSYWQNSTLSFLGAAADDRELGLIGDAREQINPAILDGTYRLPVTDASGRDRNVLRVAVSLLREAGYQIKDGKMVDAKGAPLAFEIMSQNAGQEKIALAYQRFLAPLGIKASVRTVDDSQYQQRSQSFDYDVIIKSFPSTLSPGIEQVGRWTSQSRDRQGSDNFAGVADKDVDRMVENILQARTTEDFTAAVRAHDRLLVNNSYLVPLYHLDAQWVARRKHIARPATVPLYGYQLPAWWDANAQ